mmetsp:Transcript_183161/g.445908  ORF Transcript_183161/g.445908 Transcript_183161/m.445908 type:complete len:316 (+) Transcript_183161:160-1107(+)
MTSEDSWCNTAVPFQLRRHAKVAGARASPLHTRAHQKKYFCHHRDNITHRKLLSLNSRRKMNRPASWVAQYRATRGREEKTSLPPRSALRCQTTNCQENRLVPDTRTDSLPGREIAKSSRIRAVLRSDALLPHPTNPSLLLTTPLLAPCILDSTLVERDEAGGVVGTDTGAAVADRLVGDGELAKVAADHLGLDLYDIEVLAIVHGDDRADHLRQDNHVAKVSLHGDGLLMRALGGGGCLRLLQLLDKALIFGADSAAEAAALAGVELADELGALDVKKVVEVNATEGELLESAALLQLGVALGGGLLRLFGHVD